ncbi:lipase family protein [Nocardia vinacea]|uniref:lipase family protein n=1 Tax=Nocardia vinacea TaxID=96468 RepID=UPI003434E46B
MNHLAQWVATSPVKNVCGDADGPLGVVGIPIDVAANIGDPLDSEVADKIYRQTNLTDRKSSVPLFLYHGAHDIWIPIEGVQQLRQQQCSLGVPAIFRSEPGEHLIATLSGFTEVTDWLDARLRGEPAPSECPAPR